MIYCLNIYNDQILWNRAIDPGVDRLAINPDGQLLYVPTWEGGSADHINVVDAASGRGCSKVYFSNRSHDTQYPLSGPIFQETKANDGSGTSPIFDRSEKLFRYQPSGLIRGSSAHMHVDSIEQLRGEQRKEASGGMQVANLKTGQIITADIPDHPPGDPGLLHGIALDARLKAKCGKAAPGMTRTSTSGICAIEWPRL